MSQITWMTRRLHELERIVEQLKASGSEDLRHVLEASAQASIPDSSVSGRGHSFALELPEHTNVDSNGRVCF